MTDLRFAFRQLLKNPGFTAIAVLTLALGIGANTAIFTVVDRLFVRRLPVTRPERLALLSNVRSDGQPDFYFSFPLFRDFQRESSVFSQLTAIAEESVGLGTGGATERQRALLVSGNFFSMLGLNAALGRTFASNEGAEINDAPVVVLSHGLWHRSFGSDPKVVGRAVSVNGRPFTIIGVAPREFSGTTRGMIPDLYVPITMQAQITGGAAGSNTPMLANRFARWHTVMGRLNDGVSHGQAQIAMRSLAERMNAGTNLVLLPGAQGFTNEMRDTHLHLNLLFATAGLVLLIACANLANLQLARAGGRARDIAIRLALGARRSRIVRELLTESMLLALGGSLFGLLVGVWLMDVLGHYRPSGGDIGVVASLDGRVLLFTLGAAVISGVLFGLAPAWQTSRPHLASELKMGGGLTEARAGRWNLRAALVVLQIALSLLVLASAGLCLRSLKKLQHVDPGFEPSRVVVMSFDLELNNYTSSRAEEFYLRLLERVRATPGVEAASLAYATPLGGRQQIFSVRRIEGYEPGDGEHPSADVNVVSSDYFRTLNVPFLQGKDFAANETPGGVGTVVVNDAFVRRFWPGQNVIGRHLFLLESSVEVVGVVRSSHDQNLGEGHRPTMFFSAGQRFIDENQFVNSRTLLVRTGLEPLNTLAQLRGLVRSIDANVPVFDVRTLAQQRDGSLALQRMAATLLGGFGIIGLLLAALGIYGVLAYSVSRRTREIGVRMALGAQVTDVLGLVLRQGIGFTVMGVSIGLAGAFAATRLLRGFLYEVQPLDPLTFVTVIGLLSGVAILASWLPARRAAKIDPMEALRQE